MINICLKNKKSTGLGVTAHTFSLCKHKPQGCPVYVLKCMCMCMVHVEGRGKRVFYF